MGEGAATPKPKAKKSVSRSSIACIACRERKSKCSGNPHSPKVQCSLCKRLDLECTFVLHDARKWPSSKYHVQQLRERIQKLEETLKSKENDENGAQIASQIGEASSTQQPPVLDFPTAPATSGNISHQSQTHEQYFRTSPMSSGQQPLPINPPQHDIGEQTYVTLSPGLASTSMENTGDGDVPKFGREDVFRKFNGWNGHFKMDGDGRTRYYGVTSDHHTSFESETSPDSMSLDSSTSPVGVLSGYSRFQTSLLELFWQYPHPFLRVFDREAFMQGLRMGRKTHYFSPFLLNCILLRCLHLTDDPLARRLEQGLFDRAREHLNTELERPDHNTVLGLLFLCTYISGQLKSGLGWIYTGMAGRLLLALGLHQDSTSLLEAGRITRKELDYRQMIFWSAFVNDSLWSVSLGRPNCIRLQDISCPPISPLHSSPDMALLASWVDLCIIQVEIMELYNGFRSRPSNENVIHHVARLDQTLSTWHEGLPDTLRLVPNQCVGKPSAVFVLHMAYLASLIVLHRPFAGFGDFGFEQSLLQPIDMEGGGGIDASISSMKCRSAALEIARVLKDYTNCFAYKQMPTMLTRLSFIASTTLIFGILKVEGSGQEQLLEDRASLRTCLETLGLLERFFPSAKYTRTVLHKILRSNAITLNTNSLDQSPASIDAQGETWMDLGNYPTFGFSSDMNWLLPFGPSDTTTGRCTSQNFGVTQEDGSTSNPNIGPNRQNLDPTAATASAFSILNDLPFGGLGGVG